MEKLQAPEITYDENILQDDYQRMDDVSIENEVASLQDHSSIISRERVAEDFETAEHVQVVQESNQDELELSKYKVKDNLSEICKKKTENMVKWQTKADVAIKCANIQFGTAVENRTCSEKFLDECELQQTYLQDQFDLEAADRIELNREMETAETIINILKAKLEASEDDLNKSKNELQEYENEIDEIINTYMLEDESFKKEFEMNKRKIEELKKEFEKKQLYVMENHEQFTKKKAKLEANIVMLNEELTNAQKNNEELLKKRAEHAKELHEKKNSLKVLQEELDSVSAETNQLLTEQQQTEDYEGKIAEKRLEIEIWKDRLRNQQEVVGDLTKNIESLKSENVSLLSVNKEIKQEITVHQKKYDDLVRTLEVGKADYKNKLLTHFENKKKLEQEIADVDAKILDVANNNNESKKKLESMKEDVNQTKAIISSLNTMKNNVNIEIEEQTVLDQKYTGEIETMTRTLADLDNEILQLNKDFVKKEQDFNELQSTHAKEIKDLEEILENDKADQISLTKQEEEFERIKIEDEKRLLMMKEEHDAEVKQLQSKLKMLKDEEDSLTATVKDLSEKFQVKTEKRDKLHSEYRKLQEEIDRLEEQVKAAKKDTPTTLPTTSAIFQKPTGILKVSNVKSPQKKVTFDKSINWDTLSESSTDAFFDTLLHKKNASANESKRPKSAIEHMLDLLQENSPPERETSK